MDAGSVTGWLIGLRRGDSDDARRVWDRYYHRLAIQARQILRRMRLASFGVDGEDVAAAAFNSLFRGAASGRFSRLEGRDDLWQILIVIISRKAASLAQRENRLKRGAGRVVLEADLSGGDSATNSDDTSTSGLDGLATSGINPESAAQAFEEYCRLLDLLGDETLRKIALWKLDGYTHEEIRHRLGCAPRTVTNKVELIRRIWSEMDGRP